MEVRRQQANYRCTLYRLQFCGSFQDMCRCRAFQMLHTQQSSSHPLGPSTIIYHALPRGSTWLNMAQRPRHKHVLRKMQGSSQHVLHKVAAVCLGRAVEYLRPLSPGPTRLRMVYCGGAMAGLEKETHISSLRQTWQFYSVPHLYEVFHVFPFGIKN